MMPVSMCGSFVIIRLKYGDSQPPVDGYSQGNHRYAFVR
jgi:hypothetical protein